jgi:hypothetical protein
MTYQKPALQRFGTFRELTQLGLGGIFDGSTIIGSQNGQNAYSSLSAS